MSAITMHVSEFSPKLKDVLARLKRDEEIIITDDGNQAVAKLVSVNESIAVEPEAKPKRRHAGTAEGTFWMSPDFNEPLEEFKEYME